MDVRILNLQQLNKLFSMNKILSLISAVVLLASCSEVPENGYKVSINAPGVADSTRVFVHDYTNQGPKKVLDTLYVMNEQAELSGVVGDDAFQAVSFEGIRGGVVYAVEKGTIAIDIYKDSINVSPVSGTASNEDLTELNAIFGQQGKKFAEIQNQYRDAAVKQDTVTMNVMRETLMEFQEEQANREYDYVSQHPASKASLLLINRMLQTRIKTMDEVNAVFESLDAGVKNNAFAKTIGDYLADQKKVSVGAKAPEFSAPTPDGSELALKDALGEITIVDFWAAWCKPCRMENPNLVRLYERYQDKGLKVLGVSLDRTKEDWLKAIEDDNLPWQQVSNLEYFNDPVARLYNIDAIPATFVLDKNGVIVAKGLRGEALEAKIAELLP